MNQKDLDDYLEMESLNCRLNAINQIIKEKTMIDIWARKKNGEIYFKKQKEINISPCWCQRRNHELYYGPDEQFLGSSFVVYKIQPKYCPKCGKRL